MNWKATGSSALHAALSGAALSVGAIVLDPANFKLSDLSHLGMVFLGGAILGLVGFLRNNPFGQSGPGA